jgi:uncharacterized membrane protein
MLRQFVVALAVIVVLDGIWLGVLMKDFYRRSLAPIARMADGGLDPIWPIAVLVYPVIATSFAIYDLTNHATLREWRTTMTVVDICWGAFSCAVASWVAASFARV